MTGVEGGDSLFHSFRCILEREFAAMFVQDPSEDRLGKVGADAGGEGWGGEGRSPEIDGGQGRSGEFDVPAGNDERGPERLHARPTAVHDLLHVTRQLGWRRHVTLRRAVRYGGGGGGGGSVSCHGGGGGRG